MVGCPSCGAELHFDVSLQKMVCDYCGNHFDLNQVSDNSGRDDARQSYFDSYVYLCPSCGAEIVTTDENDAVGFCQYCGGQSVIFEKVRKEWAPDGIIPFKLSQDDCKEAYKKEAKKYFFVSKKYKNPDNIGSFRGIYMPYWNYGVEVSGEIDIPVETNRVPASANTYRVDRYKIKAKPQYVAEGYSHDASLAFDDSMSEAIAPFDDNEIKSFSPGYMSGFYAEVGNVSPDEYSNLIKSQTKSAENNRIKSSQQIINVMNDKGGLIFSSEYFVNMYYNSMGQNDKLKLNISSLKKIFKPVWFLSYKNKDKIIYSSVNGQTGKVVAGLPLSPVRILLASLGVSSILFLFFLLFSSRFVAIKPSTILVFCSYLFILSESLLYTSMLKTVKSIDRENVDISGIDPFIMLFLFWFLFLGSTIVSATFIGFSAVLIALGICFGLTAILSQVVKSVKLRRHYKNKTFKLKVSAISDWNKTFKKLFPVQIIIFATYAFSLFISALDLANNFIPYSFCIVQAIELFIFALINIDFQINLAKRPLPQFKKHGIEE